MQTEQSQLKGLLERAQSRIGFLEAQQKELRAAGKTLAWGSSESNINELQQRQLHGELLGLAYMTGSLIGILGLPLNWGEAR